MIRFPFPKWIESMPEGFQKEKAKHRFTLRLACLYAHPKGSIEKFGELIGVNPHTLKSQMQSEKCWATKPTIDGIRRELGTQFIPQNLR